MFSSQLRVDPSGFVVSFNNVEQRDVEQYLVAIVPAVKCTIPGVVIQHGHVKVLVMDGDVHVLIGRGFGGIRVVYLSTGQVGVGDV